MKLLIIRLFLFLSPVIFGVESAFSEAPQRRMMGLGNVADNVLEPISLFSAFIHAGCFIMGGALLFAGVIRYFEHRRSPLMVTLTNVIFTFILGAIFILLPYIPNIIQSTGH